MPLHPYPDNIDLGHQGVEIPGSARPGWSGVWKSAIFTRAALYAPNEPKTLYQVFEQSVARHPNRNLFLRRSVAPAAAPIPIESQTWGNTLIPTTYATIQTRRNDVGSALLGLERAGRLGNREGQAGTLPAEINHSGTPYFGNSNRLKNGARRGWAVGIWSKNREEWQVVDMACHAYGLVGVSFYETLGPDVAQYINHLAELLKIARKCPTLRVVVSMDRLPKSEFAVLKSWAQSVDIELLDMSELETWGRTDGIRCDPGPVKGVEGEEELDMKRVITISYTSGTTGDPKGVVLTNENMAIATISNGTGNSGVLSNGEEWRFLSYLPLSHIYEFVVMYGDGTVCFTTGDTTKLLEDAQLIKPHFMAGVPRVWNRIHAAVKTQMNAGGLKGALLTRAVNTKLENWRTKGEVKHTLYDALVFKKIRNLLGGELVYISSGAAPLSGEVHELLKICFGCDAIQDCRNMHERVSQIKTPGMSKFQPPVPNSSLVVRIPWDISAVGTCGQIQPVNDICLMDVPEMGGANVFVGYLHDEVNTAKTIDKDGWMHTGDVGEIDPAGRLKIVDRIKNVVKLSQGEYVALEKLEGMYALDPMFASLMVYGDSMRSSLVALGVLDPEKAAELVSRVLRQRFTASDVSALEDAVQNKKVRKAVVDALAVAARKYKLNGFEQVKGVHLTVIPFPDDVLTPTLKVKRNVAAKRYKKEIDRAYEESEGVEAGGKIQARL